MSDRRSLSALHIPALDGIRGLAILLVIPHNAGLLAGEILHGPGYLAKEFTLAGWIGVQLFFVLSGYLITGALLDSQGSKTYYSSFFARRVLRIFPLYFGILFLTFCILIPLHLAPAAVEETSHNQIWLWLFLSNWAAPQGHEVKGFAHFWSLAVEEQFYLLWPFLIARLKPKTTLAVCAGICLLALLIRIGMRLDGSSPENLYEFTIARMDALAFGAAAAAALRTPVLAERLKHLSRHFPWIALILLGLGAATTNDYQRTGLATQTFGFTILALAFTALILAFANAPQGRPTIFRRLIEWAPLRSAGKYSYGMYVIHVPLHLLLGLTVLGAAGRFPRASFSLAYGAAITLASYLLAVASYHLYEKHFLRLKRLFPIARDAPGRTGVR